MIKIVMQDDVSLGRTFFLPSIVFIWACYLLNNHFLFLFLSLHSVVLFVLFIYYFHVLFFVWLCFIYFFQWIDDLL